MSRFSTPEEALNALCEYFGNNKSDMARAAKVARNTVGWWYRRAQVGRSSAVTIDLDPNIPFTKEDLRPDIDW